MQLRIAIVLYHQPDRFEEGERGLREQYGVPKYHFGARQNEIGYLDLPSRMKLTHHFTMQFSLAWPIIFCLACAFLIIVPFVTETRDSLIGTGMILTGKWSWCIFRRCITNYLTHDSIMFTGFPMYYLFVYLLPRHPQWLRSFVNGTTRLFQKLLPVATTEKELADDFWNLET